VGHIETGRRLEEVIWKQKFTAVMMNISNFLLLGTLVLACSLLSHPTKGEFHTFQNIE
jgi:hypothetical protein